MGADPATMDLFEFLKRDLPDRVFPEVVHVLGPFSKAVNNKRWMVAAVAPPLAGSIIKSALDRVLDGQVQLYELSLSGLMGSHPFLTRQQLPSIACFELNLAVCGDVADSEVPKRVGIERIPSQQLSSERRQSLSAACFLEARRATACFIPPPSPPLALESHLSRGATLLLHAVAGTLFNYLAPLYAERTRSQSDKWQPAAGLLHEAVYVGRTVADSKVGIWLSL